MKFYQLPVVMTVLLLYACANQPSQDISRDNASASDLQSSPYNNNLAAIPESTSQNHQNQKHKITDPAQFKDLWVRIQNNLEISRDTNNTSVRDKLAFFASKQEFLDRVADRASPYLYHIVEELDKRNMPEDLALLPIVESAYQPFAQSPSRAAGLWQFIPSTGKYYGLKQTWWYDGRRDIISATDAALTYLQKLHDEFDGDWLLALAAYNAGEVNISRAIEKNRSQGKKTDFWSLHLNSETMGYVPSFLAIAELVANPNAYQVSLKSIPNKPYFKVVDTGGQIDLATAAKLSGQTTEEVHMLNPGINRWATDPDGPYRLLMPLDKADTFKQKLQEIPASERVKWQLYTIKKGDTLGRIALLYGTDVRSLKQANNLHSTLIHPGNRLRIPGGKYGPREIADTRSSSKPKLSASTTGETGSYTVKSGDSLWSISRQYNISIDDICALNNLSPKSVLKPGKILTITNTGGGIMPVANHESVNGSYTGHIVHTVKRGDTLWLIAKEYGVTVRQIQKWNDLGKNSALMPGQSLDIYTNNTPTDV